MPELVIPLKDVIVDAEQNMNLAALPPDQALDQLWKCYAFLSPSVVIRIDGDTAIITYPTDQPAQTGQATSDFNAGLRYAQRGEYNKAIRLFRRVVEAWPTHTNARRNLGMAYLESGQKDKAVTLIVETLRLDPKDVWAYILMGNIYSKHEQRSDVAIKYYQKAFEIRPDDPYLLTNYGGLVAKAGKFDEAHDLFEKALVADPTYASAHYGLALLYLKNDQPNRTIETLEKLFAQPRSKDPRSKPMYAEARSLAVEAEQQLAARTRQSVKDWVEMRGRIVSELTGYRVEFIPDQSLKVLAATAQPAWKYGRDRHIIRYRDNQPQITSHLLGHELEHIVLEHEARTYGRNRAFASTPQTMEYAIRSVAGYVQKMQRMGYPEPSVRQVVQEMVHGLNNWLFNCPLDMIIEHRLFHAHAVLRPSQFLSLQATQQTNVAVVTDKGIQQVSPPSIYHCNVAMNAAYALFTDALYNGMTDYAAPYRSTDEYNLAVKLHQLAQDTITSFRPGDEYQLVDEYARLLQLEQWHTWQDDPHRQPTVEGPTNLDLLKEKEPAAIMYCLAALDRFDGLTPDQILPIVSEIGLLGRGGIDYTSSEQKYTLRSIPGVAFSGLQLLCLMFVGYKMVDPSIDTGLDLGGAYEQALKLRGAGT